MSLREREGFWIRTVWRSWDAQVEYVQNIADAGAARWHLTPPCMVEVEDRRTRLLTWLGLAGATTLQRFCCLLLEVRSPELHNVVFNGEVANVSSMLKNACWQWYVGCVAMNVSRALGH